MGPAVMTAPHRRPAWPGCTTRSPRSRSRSATSTGRWSSTTGCSAGRRGRSSTTCRPVHHATELRGEPVHYALRGAEVYVGALNFELLQPLEGPNLWSELIDRRGEGIASIATMFHERADGDAVKREFLARYGIPVSMKADIGDHIEYYYLDTEARFGCLIESGSGHAIDFVRPAKVYPSEDAVFGPSPLTGLTCPITQVTLVVRDLDERVAAYEDAFGWGPWARFDGRSGLLSGVPAPR